MRIAFQSNQLSMTGTEVALYDYAHHNELQLGHKSVVFYEACNVNNHPQAIAKFSHRFGVIPYQNFADLEKKLSLHKCDLLYTIKSGKRDGLMSKQVPTMVHAVFPTSPHQIHGASYAYISPWLSMHCSQNKIPAVPHIVEMPKPSSDLWDSLGIPPKAMVLGGYGGRISFDVPCAISAVKRLLAERGDIYFLFMNFAPFVDHPRAIFLPATTDMDYKARFVGTCDAMLHARLQGESFGLAVGEFSVLNKPVFTYKRCKHSHHLDMLGDKGLVYEDEASLVNLVGALSSQLILGKDWDCYSASCNPQIVMAAFDKYLIQPALSNETLMRPAIKITWRDELAYWKFKWSMRFER